MSILTKLRQPKVLMMRWGLNGVRMRFIFLILCFFLVAVCVYASRYFVLFQNIDMVQAVYHGELYCNKPGTVVGKEGQLQFMKGFKQRYKLKQVHIVIRHGDRAPIVLNTLPNSVPVEVSCRFNRSWRFYDDLEEMKRGASAFKVTGEKIYPIVQEKDVCNGGQLTPIGFSQHLNNGKFLKRQYGDFLDSIEDPSRILALSTPYSRTVQSVASLLYGMFGDKFLDEKIEIKVQNDKYRETHFLKDDQDDFIYCPALAQKLREIWKVDDLHELRKTIDPLRKEYAKIFASHRGNIASLDRLVDILYVSMCHRKAFPKGPNGGVTFKLARKSFELAHRLISSKHLPTAELQTLAILSQIVHKTANHINSQSKKDSHKLVLFSAHDTVVTPILEILGTHNGKWPPYASRVLFEVWKDTDDKKTVSKDGNQLSMFDGYYIRVLYNGNDITKEVKFCKGQVLHNQLCPLSAFVKYVADEQFDGNNYFERIKNLCVGTEA